MRKPALLSAVIGDFQERCHSLAAFQAAWINGSACRFAHRWEEGVPAPCCRAPSSVDVKDPSKSERLVIGRSVLESKFWLQRLPSVEEARPACCSACGEVSRPDGEALMRVGHGVRGLPCR